LSSCLLLPPPLPAPSIFPSITCFRRHILCKDPVNLPSFYLCRVFLYIPRYNYPNKRLIVNTAFNIEFSRN
jgi:hypothetical protein